ncbi:response regulator transcription factor [Campylobacter mucosalis]|uniref:response regulator transcription factor n=1 Tax=Campylobacter mucosalis TaxID=202 RepID=UPI001470536F|nr:response regulator transcription factor [Campylobacter mucosalis]
MKLVLFTKNNSLQSLWKSYKFNKKPIFAHSQDELVKNLKDTNGVILGLDVAVSPDINVFIKDLLSKFSDVKILALANEPNFINGKLLLAYGVKGYANSHMQEVHFNDAVNTIINGNVWIYPEFIQQMIGEIVVSSAPAKSRDVFEQLSVREKEIAEFIYKGMSNKEISEISGITLRTVKAHTTAIYSKIGVKDRLGLVLLRQKQDA